MADPQHPNALFQTFVTGQLVASLLADAVAPSGLRPDEYAVESAVGAFGPITPTELAGRLGMRPTTLSAHIQRMAARGHVERAPNERDARSYFLELTPQGRAAVESGFAGLRAAIEAVEIQLDGGGDDVRAALARFQQALRGALQGREAPARSRTNS